MWIPPKAPNDWGDAVKMSRALWHIIRGEFNTTAEAKQAAA
jgi:hypothetical protein